MTGTCDDCAYNVYDDEMDEYVCEAYLDEDEFYRLMQTGKNCFSLVFLLCGTI